jgi:hypothetical protein
MAGLADDRRPNRQTCIDVLCAYLRMPYEPDPGEEAPTPERLAFRASREVRHTVIRVITAHLKNGAAVSWQGRTQFPEVGPSASGGGIQREDCSSEPLILDDAHRVWLVRRCWRYAWTSHSVVRTRSGLS